jgi:hypothetical protein
MDTRKQILRIKKDCLKLKKQGQLHEYGQGQLDLINQIEELLTKPKYSLDDLRFTPNKLHIPLAILTLANVINELKETLKPLQHLKKRPSN